MRGMKTMVWIACAGLVIGSQALCLEIPKDIPKTDLDLYLQRHHIGMGVKVTVSPLKLPDVPGFKPVTMADLPDFSADVEQKVTKKGKVHVNGLVSTVNYEQYPGREVKNERKLKVKPSGFKKEVEVRTFWQPGKAPLAVTILGFGQRADDKNARTWQADLFNAGNHVLSFDSIIRNNMNRASGHGVAGNIWIEGQLCTRIIQAVLKATDKDTGKPFSDRVSSIRIVGFSYGGNLALQALRDPRVRNWTVDRVLLVSTPVDFRRTAQLFDLYNMVDASHFSTLSLAKMLSGYTPKGNEPTEREKSLMRGGLGYVFHGDVALIFEDNAKRYTPELRAELRAFSSSDAAKAHRKAELARQKARFERARDLLESRKDTLAKEVYKESRRNLEEEDKARRLFASIRLDDYRNWTFKHGRVLLWRRYWDARNDYSDLGRLKVLMKGAPNFVQVVIAEDDPLNQPEDLQVLKRELKAPQLLLIPHGGHLGMSGTKWFQALMAKFFAVK